MELGPRPSRFHWERLLSWDSDVEFRKCDVGSGAHVVAKSASELFAVLPALGHRTLKAGTEQTRPPNSLGLWCVGGLIVLPFLLDRTLASPGVSSPGRCSVSRTVDAAEATCTASPLTRPLVGSRRAKLQKQQNGTVEVPQRPLSRPLHLHSCRPSPPPPNHSARQRCLFGPRGALCDRSVVEGGARASSATGHWLVMHAALRMEAGTIRVRCCGIQVAPPPSNRCAPPASADRGLPPDVTAGSFVCGLSPEAGPKHVTAWRQRSCQWR